MRVKNIFIQIFYKLYENDFCIHMLTFQIMVSILSLFFFRTLSCISVVFMSDIWSGIAARCWDIQHLLSITTDSVRCSAVNWTNQHNWLRGISIALFKSVFSKMSFMLDYKLKVSAVVQTLALLLWMYCY